jgi:class 3 adenylate cyclase/TolB-like protein
MSISRVDASRLARHTKVIAVADVVESVRLMEQDEQEFIRRWHGFITFFKNHLPQETGRMHKSLGDGLMVEFSDPEGCIRAALAMQAWFDEGNHGLPLEEHVHLRIGAHVAEFVADENDIYGTDVNLTARIATLAGPGEIVISAALRDRIRGELEPFLEDLGQCHLKHVRHPVRAYRVGRAGRAPVLPAAGAGRVPTRVALAVLPFTDDVGSLGLGEAVADEAVAALAQLGEVQVVSRLATTVATPERAHYLLRGHARHTDGRIGLFVELSEAASGHVVWAHSFKGSAADLFCENAEVIRALVAGVASALMAREAERARGQPLPALAGHTLLLAAIDLMHQLAPADLERARAMLEHLLERNRRHPAVLAWLAHWHVLHVQQGGPADRRTDVELALQHANAALQADAQAPLVLCLAGHAHVHLLHDLDTAAARYAQALHQRPDDALAVLLQGELLALRGDGAGALRLAERALRLCALAHLRPWYEQVAAEAALVAGDGLRALQLAESAAAVRPWSVAAHCTLVLAQAACGQAEAARQSVQGLLRLRPDFSLRLYREECPALPAIQQRAAEALASAGVPAG